jgi:hypothetical protein
MVLCGIGYSKLQLLGGITEGGEVFSFSKNERRTFNGQHLMLN